MPIFAQSKILYNHPYPNGPQQPSAVGMARRKEVNVVWGLVGVIMMSDIIVDELRGAKDNKGLLLPQGEVGA